MSSVLLVTFSCLISPASSVPVTEFSQSHQGAQNVEYPAFEGLHMDHQVQFLKVLLYLSWLSEKCKQGNQA